MIKLLTPEEQKALRKIIDRVLRDNIAIPAKRKNNTIDIATRISGKRIAVNGVIKSASTPFKEIADLLDNDNSSLNIILFDGRSGSIWVSKLIDVKKMYEY